MQNAITKRGVVGPIKRSWRAWRAHVRLDQAVVALFVLLTLGLGEPLLCVLHCQLWTPLANQSYLGMQHQHQHHMMMHDGSMNAMPGMAMDDGSMSMPSGTHLMSVTLYQTGMSCFEMQSGSGTPTPSEVPPSPVHELLVPLAIGMLMIALRFRVDLRPPGDPPRPVFSPLLRPPIASIA